MQTARHRYYPEAGGRGSYLIKLKKRKKKKNRKRKKKEKGKKKKVFIK